MTVHYLVFILTNLQQDGWLRKAEIDFNITTDSVESLPRIVNLSANRVIKVQRVCTNNVSEQIPFLMLKNIAVATNRSNLPFLVLPEGQTFPAEKLLPTVERYVIFDNFWRPAGSINEFVHPKRENRLWETWEV